MFGVISTLLLTIVILSVAHWVRHRRYQHEFFKRMGVPFVKPRLISGNDSDFRDPTTTPITVISKWRKRYGDVFGYFHGSRPMLVVTNLDMVRQILIKDFHVFSNRPSLVIKAEPVVTTLVGLRDQRWKDVRALLTPTFSMAKMKLMAGIMNEKIDTLLSIMDDHSKSKKSIELYTTFQGLTLDVICECALAIKSNCQLNQNDWLLNSVRGFLKNAINVFITLAICFPAFGSLLSFFSNKVASSGRLTNMIVSHLKKVISMRRKDSETKKVDVLQMMLEASETVLEERVGKEGLSSVPKKKMLSDNEIIANAWVFLLGGFETTANAITFTSFLLSKHKHYQDQLYEEIKSIVKDPSSPVTYEHVSEMKLLDQIFSESLRLYPPVVTFISREASQDVQVGGFNIPKNTSILIPIWEIHRDPQNWPNPEEFDPSRFSLTSKATSTRHPMAYLPFGAGPRNCVGMRFGQLEAKLAIAKIILNYELELAPETEDPPPLTVPTVAINPAKGIYMHALRRT
ncbi:Cytochrome P450 [Trinorchestia longiramus]|nr:Cytochrome P450 [Trinorchestia longiramus]